MLLKFVSYYRVSTKKQEESGAGLQAQRYSVEQYIKRQPHAQIIAEYTETESGRKKNRPQLTQALATCKKHKATLLIAKLDRLARNVHFISGLLESKIDFIACDMPNADKTMLQIMAVFGEHERDAISQRIKEALAEKKKQGVQLGITGKDRAKENKAEAERFRLYHRADSFRVGRGRHHQSVAYCARTQHTKHTNPTGRKVAQIKRLQPFKTFAIEKTIQTVSIHAKLFKTEVHYMIFL